jgi:hypothetical protein
MLNTRLLIVQLLGSLLLLCSYFLSDEPDSLSVMHFDPNPACPSVFTKSTKSTPNAASLQTSLTQQNNNEHKTNLPKHVSFEVILPVDKGYLIREVMPVVYAYSLPDAYSYLFYVEINPPPPKSSAAPLPFVA